jgi:hypothetical protein
MGPEPAQAGEHPSTTWGYLAGEERFVDEVFAPATFERVARDPTFPGIMRRYAQSRLAVFAASSGPIRWLTRDLARTGLLYAAMVRDSVMGGATVAGLCESAKADHTCSRGRVLAWVEGARELRLITVPPGPGAWTKRRLVLDPSLYDGAVRRLRTECDGYAPLAPELTWLSGMGRDALRAYFQTLVELSALRPDIVRGADMPISRLLHTDGGAELMFHLLALQPPGQARLLEPTTLNMTACASQAGISRIQIHRLLKIAEEAGLFHVVDRRTVVFTPTMLQNLAWVLIVYMQVLRVAERVARLREGCDQRARPLANAHPANQD